MSTEFVRLRLTLEPTLPSRTPTSSSRRGHGFVLRLVDGPAIEHDDPPLRAFAAVIALAVRVVVDHDHAPIIAALRRRADPDAPGLCRPRPARSSTPSGRSGSWTVTTVPVPDGPTLEG
jgi:hypothetical protein